MNVSSRSLKTPHPTRHSLLATPSSSMNILRFLTFQISSLSISCYYRVRQLRSVRPDLDSTTACTIPTSVVHSKLDYCNSVYYNLPKSYVPNNPPPVTDRFLHWAMIYRISGTSSLRLSVNGVNLIPVSPSLTHLLLCLSHALPLLSKTASFTPRFQL